MHTFLQSIGDSLAVVLPPEIRKQWNLDALTSIEIRSDEHGILIVPVMEKSEAIAAAVQDANARYAETFRRLAE